MSDYAIVFHANCRDGQVAAWVARRATHERKRSEPVLIPAQYQQPLATEAFAPHREIYFVDFCPTRADLERICYLSDRVTILDHHKTAAEMIDGWPVDARPTNLHVVMDQRRSGAGITWDFFYPDHRRPTLVDYVEDRDLWRWALPGSREVSAWLETIPLTGLISVDRAQAAVDDDLPRVISAGAAVLAARDNRTQRSVRNAVFTTIDGHVAGLVNTSSDISETCDAILNRYAEVQVAISYFDNLKEGKRIFSLRSRPNGVDVAEVAYRRGGGGHATAAGFSVPIQELDSATASVR